MRHGWRCFIHDTPGERFLNHYRRAQRGRTRAKLIARVGAGAVLTTAGLALLFLPGPGWLFVGFGMAMFAGESRGLARSFDRTELTARAQGRRLHERWRSASPVSRVLAVAAMLAAVGVGSAAAWAMWSSVL